MQPDPVTTSPRTGTRIFLIGTFFVLLWLPLTDSVFHWDRTPASDEKRVLAKLPKYSRKETPLREYLAGVGDYYADHFGCRNRLVGWNNRWKREWFNESSVSEVLIGKDGWLFYETEHMTDDVRGTKGFTPEDLRNWQENLESRRDWLAARGIKYVFMVPPDKQSVYPEYLPDWLKRTGPHNRLDQLLAHMQRHSTVQILDVRTVLRNAKDTAPTYHNTDSHWNDFGGFLGYQALIQALTHQIPDLGQPLPLSAFDRRTGSGQGMDLAVMLGQEQSLKEKNMAYLDPRPPLARLESLEDPSILPRKWPTGRAPVYTNNPDGRHSMIMFRDSFAGGLIPYVGYNFRRVVYISSQWNFALIEREKPDVVVDQAVERQFNHFDSERMRLPTR